MNMNDPSSYTDLDIPTYQQHRENQIEHFLLDVREPWEYVEKRIPGAVNIPLGELDFRLDELPDLPVVVVCEHGIRSVYGAQFLAEAGHPAVYNLLGGTAEWVMRGLKTE
jgi:adenylyltransferase/sulfurtransferase